MLAAARGAVGVDTGLTHLAAALCVPIVGIYGATDPQATGVLARGPAANLGGLNGFPSPEDVVRALLELGVTASAGDRLASQMP